MFRIVISIFLATILFSWSVVASSSVSAKWSLGLGLEGRLSHEVNPGYTDVEALGQFFQQIRFSSWATVLEVGLPQDRSSTDGGFHIRSQSLQTSIWGRYFLLDTDSWMPFFSLGAGMIFDTVKSSYADQSDVRRGSRALIGAGAGVNRVLWRHFLLEAEGRAALVRDRKDPALSVIFRAGVRL
jgi:hypothetical protein